MKSLFIVLVLLVSSLSQANRFDRPERPIRPERPGRGERLIIQSVGSFRTNKLISETFRFEIPRRSPQVFRIELVGIRGTAEIENVQVVYGNGQVENLTELRGSLRDGRKNAAHVYGRYVEEIRVTATSGLLGSRGQVQVNVGVFQ